jgi:hypothetical protein
MFDEYIERPSIPIRWAGQFSPQPGFLRFGPPVAVPLGHRRHASLYIMTASVGLLIGGSMGVRFFRLRPVRRRSTARVKRAKR